MVARGGIVPQAGVTYDLYDCGVVMFDLTKYKQQFKVNF